MKKIHLIALAAVSSLLLPLVAMALPTSWDYASGILQPLQSQWSAQVKGSSFTATSTSSHSTFPYASSTAISVSSLVSGNCVQAGAGGLLATISAPCNSGSTTGTSKWATSTDLTSIYPNAATKVGIGTTHPGSILEVQGTTTTSHLVATSTGSVTAPSIVIGATGASGFYNIGGSNLSMTNGVSATTWDGTAFYPNTDSANDLGIDASNRWNKLFTNFASSTSITSSGSAYLATAGGSVGIASNTPATSGLSVGTTGGINIVPNATSTFSGGGVQAKDFCTSTTCLSSVGQNTLPTTYFASTTVSNSAIADLQIPVVSGDRVFFWYEADKTDVCSNANQSANFTIRQGLGATSTAGFLRTATTGVAPCSVSGIYQQTATTSETWFTELQNGSNMNYFKITAINYHNN